jgi:hypothetical protein
MCFLLTPEAVTLRAETSGANARIHRDERKAPAWRCPSAVINIARKSSWASGAMLISQKSIVFDGYRVKLIGALRVRPPGPTAVTVAT